MPIKKTYFLLSAFMIILLNCSGPDYANLARGNRVVLSIPDMPSSVNYYIEATTLSSYIFNKTYEPLYRFDDNTYEPVPCIAESLTISEDHLSYTFKINPDAKWPDGTQITANDVFFTYNTIMNPDNMTGMFRVSFEESVESVELIDTQTIRFNARRPEWMIMINLMDLRILPEKYFKDRDFNKDFNFDLPGGSGPYMIDRVEQGRFISMKRNPQYWRAEIDKANGNNRFDSITYRVITNDEIAYEALKKGDIDLLYINSSERWNRITRTETPDNMKAGRLAAMKIANLKPKHFQAFYFNLRKPKFQDIRVRRALRHLLDIATLNEKIMFNEYYELKSFAPGFFQNHDSVYYPEFNPAEARRLLTEAGWNRVDTDGILINAQGERFEIDFPLNSETGIRHLTVYREELLKAGIKLNLEVMSYSAYIKQCWENHDFDMAWVNWGGGYIFPMINEMWRSTQADIAGSNNIGGYSNPAIDTLLTDYTNEFDVSKRLEILRQIDLILLNDMAAMLIWGDQNSRIVFWNKFDTPEFFLRKYVDYEDGVTGSWAVNPEMERLVIDSLINNTQLEPLPFNIDNTGLH